jgi:hypothetical protein
MRFVTSTKQIAVERRLNRFAAYQKTNLQRIARQASPRFALRCSLTCPGQRQCLHDKIGQTMSHHRILEKLGDCGMDVVAKHCQAIVSGVRTRWSLVSSAGNRIPQPAARFTITYEWGCSAQHFLFPPRSFPHCSSHKGSFSIC